jgi:C-terminal processing protease CtpA/Prc|mmetsp:Transcript_68791/g.153533  ORF Transcript_68791/g.153533 Transcript_68791/m.153533 type:complete len:99 (-) Transcript_68791:522-818(-)
MISSGFSFDDGCQRLVSVQKPLGLTLEPLDEEELCGVVVAAVQRDSNAERAGVLVGDVLVAVGNLDLSAATLEAVLEAIAGTPGRVLNLRFQTFSRGN